jgi:hypothetical protein
MGLQLLRNPCTSSQLVLPEAKDFPVLATQRSIYKPVARTIYPELVEPEFPVRCRRSSMYWTTMPEATINENCDTLRLEYEVWLDRLPTRLACVLGVQQLYRRVTSPAGNSLRSKDDHEPNLRRDVSSASNA